MYYFKWKKRFFWKKIKVIGHRYEADQNKMVLFLENGAVTEIKNWRNCEVFLGQDWVMAKKKEMEQQAGSSIPLNV